jgi:putative membrane-bound dehydrogenase-like protein
MKRFTIAIIFVSFWIVSSETVNAFRLNQESPHLAAKLSEAGDKIEVFETNNPKPILTQVAQVDHRPFLHPIAAPDGKGLVTEYSPGHHKHQTGVYWGFTRVNGRDYFHHPQDGYWRRTSVQVLTAEAASSNDSVQWQTVYDMLAEDGSVVLEESQIWSMKSVGGEYVLSLDWSGTAKTDVTVSKYDYGGLFLRMPWKQGIHGHAVNSARQRDQRAEGQRSVWLDVGMQVEGRDDMAHIAIFDHPNNKGFPQPWRVDGQLGVGPVRARLGDWKIKNGATEKIKHQLIVYTGELDDVKLMDKWAKFSGQPMAWAQWHQAQQEGKRAEFLTPEKAVESMTIKPGFKANVWASEPMITQPMAFCWDSKGRMWVAENLDYEDRGKGFANFGTSKILIIEDTDRDGVADSRKVFAEGIPFPAGMAVGMGGLWLGAPPNLLFVPDADGDDKADMDDIEIRLTGWGIKDRHETLNSFHWGPDGWLYGCQGFATPSQVGKPKDGGKLLKHKDDFPKEFAFEGTPVDINGGVWRYHPTKDRFEVVAHGFSNPWGLDYDSKGQLFITACVIPHLWHVIPSGIYHRQGGSHYNPFYYQDIRTIADHHHRSAHGGARVYQSDAFPDEYKNRIFMANIHEHAVLTDILEPAGSGYIGKHGDDFALANNAQWIGFSVEVGPEGGVYVLDWHDADICGNSVNNKDTGRIFRFMPDQSAATDFENRYVDLTKLSDVQLVAMHWHESNWHSRRARTILQHRAQHREIDQPAVSELEKVLSSAKAIDYRLRAFWTLHVIDALSEEDLVSMLANENEYLRAWSIQFLCEDFDAPAQVNENFIRMASSDESPVVRLYLASAVQRLKDSAIQWSIIEGLVTHAEDASDHNLPKMIWFGLEPLVPDDPIRATKLASVAKIPLISRHVARRLSDADKFAAVVNGLKLETGNQQTREQMLLGLRDGLEGRYNVDAPADWPDVYKSLHEGGGYGAQLALELSQQFGDKVAADTMLVTLLDDSADGNDRRVVLKALAGRKHPALLEALPELLDDDELLKDAIRATAAFDNDEVSRNLIGRYGKLDEANKLEVVHALAARSGSGRLLTEAIKSEAIPRRDIPAYVARLLRQVVGNSFVDVWGPIDELSADKEAQLTKYRSLLSDDALAKAELGNGRAVFKRTCASCHKLFGHGGEVGPDITGANRSDREYLLSNILTPSAVIQDEYRMSMVLIEDGRLYSGIPADENERVLKLKVANEGEPVVISKSEIESRKVAPVSMMPDGLLNTLSDMEVVDLIGYLQSTRQVELPGEN